MKMCLFRRAGVADTADQPAARVLCRFAKRQPYEALPAFGDAIQPAAPTELDAQPAVEVTYIPSSWKAVGPGGLVLASVGPGEGWFESVVAIATSLGVFVLRWLDWPGEKAFPRHVSALALLPH